MYPTLEKEKRIPETYQKYGMEVEHGDYKRIAELTVSSNGTPYSADYVRKVIHGDRINQQIVKKAQAYFREKKRMMKRLMDIKDK
ncbi:MAG: hypothetical protein AAFQ98_16320 [Bacteroidota bacterium]